MPFDKLRANGGEKRALTAGKVMQTTENRSEIINELYLMSNAKIL